MARDGERCRMAVIRAFLLGFDERILGGGRSVWNWRGRPRGAKGLY